MQIQFALPEKQFVTETTDSITKKIRLYAALGMYRTGKLSVGAACELAGIDHYAFLDFCKEESVPIQTQTPIELEKEFQQLLKKR